MSTKDQRLAELRHSIPEASPKEALSAVRAGGLLLDVREPDEIAQGSPEAAERIGRGYLELRIDELARDRCQPIYVMCSGGTRSLFAADSLARMGYSEVRSVAGGFNRWKDEGLPVAVPRMLDAAGRERYARQLVIPEIGEAGQARLGDASVALIGAGGLGSPAALYLAAAGVGRLGIVDHDYVDRSNLQRQVIHADSRIGMAKTASARCALEALNPDVTVVEHPVRLSSDNVEAVLGDYELVIDGADNFPTRYLVNDACVKLGLPNVHGSVFRFDGQVSVFWPAADPGKAPCYRCLFPEPPPPEAAPSCAEAGVLGVLPGVIGTLQAIEALKWLLGQGDGLVGRLLCFDALSASFREVRVPADPACPWCRPGADPPAYIDYEAFCAAGAG